MSAKTILIYGPNGSGKTSFCESLEYALMGEVGEADAKRIAGASYLSNIYERRFTPPVLRASDHTGAEVTVEADPSNFRFCFVEKNRIDSFSRIAARPSGQRSELIATLFGMEDFAEFVSNFNESIDGQLVVTPAKRSEFELKRAAMVEDQALVDNDQASLKLLDAEEVALAASFAVGLSYLDLKGLFQAGEKPSRLQELNLILNAVSPVLYDVQQTALLNAFQSTKDAWTELQNYNQQLSNKREKISFRDLYAVVLSLQASVSDRCPACDTPLVGPNHVTRNPFEKAKTGLDDLKDLAELQELQITAVGKFTAANDVLRGMFKTMSDFLANKNEHQSSIGAYFTKTASLPSDEWWLAVEQLSSATSVSGISFQDVCSLAQSIEIQDENNRAIINQRQVMIAERDRLLQFQLLIQAQDAKRLAHIERTLAAKVRISAFDADNAPLLQSANQEALDIARDASIKTAYDQFLTMLRHYLSLLPSNLIAGLNDSAMRLYNDFNREDLDGDRLSTLSLPLTGEQKIEIAFRANPNLKVDALQVLSEGHIRCLGLAILLAKNLQMNSPLVVFDDAINAIDHDHRRGIRETIFQSQYFDEKQIIVTCHSNEFIKDIQQNLTPQARLSCKAYLLKNHIGDYHPIIKRDIPSRNYIDIARASREDLNERAALDASRKALEVWTVKIWRWLGKYQQGQISILLDRVDGEPQLRNLCEGLYKKISKANSFSHANKDAVTEALGRMLGIPEDNLVWTYLNKGTHEEADRDDFDANKVETIVQTLEALEGLNL